MKYLESNWSNEELKAYLILFCLNINFNKQNQDIDFSTLNIRENELNAIQKEFNKDNDYQSIQKIYKAIESNNCSTDYINSMFQEIKEIIISSGRKYSYFMKNILSGFERTILNAA